MTTMALYVGADNATGQIDLDRIETIVSKTHAGYTVIPASGIWQGTREPSAVVMISDESADAILATARTLKSELNQDAVGVQVMPELTFV